LQASASNSFKLPLNNLSFVHNILIAHLADHTQKKDNSNINPPLSFFRMRSQIAAGATCTVMPLLSGSAHVDVRLCSALFGIPQDEQLLMLDLISNDADGLNLSCEERITLGDDTYLME
jgi:hypothetical protein